MKLTIECEGDNPYYELFIYDDNGKHWITRVDYDDQPDEVMSNVASSICEFLDVEFEDIG